MTLPTSKLRPIRLLDHHDENCKCLEHSGFYRAELLTNLPGENLAQPIHKIFNFLLSDYPNLQQVLRLSSCFIEASLPVFHTILCVPPKTTNEIDSKGNPVFEFEEPLDELTKKQQEAVREKLDALAEELVFQIGNMGTDASHLAVTSVREECRHPLLPGMASTISLQSSTMNLLAHPTSLKNDPIRRQWEIFHLSHFICHELIHASVSAAGPNFAYRNFYLGPDAKMTEAGLEWERFLFGGQPQPGEKFASDAHYFHNGIPSQLEGQIVLRQCPDPEMLEHYTSAATMNGFVLENCRNVPPLQDMVAVTWNLPFLYVNKLLQDGFWEEALQKPWRGAVHCPKETAILGTVDGGLEMPPAHLVESGIPKGYILHSGGLVHRPELKDGDIEHLIPRVPPPAVKPKVAVRTLRQTTLHAMIIQKPVLVALEEKDPAKSIKVQTMGKAAHGGTGTSLRQTLLTSYMKKQVDSCLKRDQKGIY